MKWSLLIGRFWGTEIRLHASMLLLIPYAVIAFKPEGLGSLARVLLLLAGIFACVALHEVGHTLAARLFGIQVSSIVLWPLGGVANLSRRPEKVLPDLLISAAGPATNLLIFALLGVITAAERIVETSFASPELTISLREMGVFPFLAGMTAANLALAVFNLVPVYPLDGGQIARGVLKGLFGEQRADLLMLIFSLPLALALTILGLVIGDVIVVLTGLIMVLASLTLNLRLTNGLSLGVLYLLDRAGYYLKRSDFDPAIREYSQAIQRSPNRAGLYVSRAVAFMNLMELQAARADIDCALTLDPSNYTAWGLHGELLSLAKDRAGALAAYNRAIEIRPGWAIAYLDRAGLNQAQGNYTQAVEDMNKAVELGRGSPVGYLLRSQLRFEMGDLDGSHADMDQALRYAPQWMLAFPEIFMSNLENHLNWALAYYWRAIERMPDNYQVYQGRGDACRANHRLDWAIVDYHRAIRLAPERGELFLARGRAYHELGQTENAAADLREAARLADRAHIRRQAETLLARMMPALSMQPSGGAAAVQPGPAASPTGSSAAAPADDKSLPG